jgi:hypothetical protein
LLSAGGAACPAALRLDLLPEFLPVGALGLGQFAEGRLAAHAGEVRVRQPVLHRCGDGRAGLVRFLLQELAPRPQVGVQPVEGLPAEAGALLLIEAGRVLALPAAGEGGGAGGVVAVAGNQPLGKCRFGSEGPNSNFAIGGKRLQGK